MRCLGLAILLAGSIAPLAAAEDRSLDFSRDVRPILSNACFHCHGPDAATRKAGLRLDRAEEALGETPSGGRAIVPGDRESSELYWRITSQDDFERMPPPDSGRSLSDAQRDILARWIDEGASWRPHWSFVPPGDVPIPGVENRQWPRTPIDSFILERLEREGLQPAGQASPERLLRRLSFDLTGLPPSLDELDAFYGDTRPDAYERVVDRLLASPHFGERMAVDWLDAARYADTYGYQADVYRAVWPYRDWVVQAFNQNVPYDQFLTWQIAGDLLPSPTRDQILATAFNRLHRQTNEGGSIEEEYRIEYVNDRVDTLGTAVLGLTLACARCHDHKYDPISQREYYQLTAFFNSIDESGLYSHFTDAVPGPSLPLLEPGQEEALARVEAEIRAAEAALGEVDAATLEAFETWLAGDRSPGLQVGLSRDLIGAFDLDEVVGGTSPNAMDGAHPARLVEEPRAVPGKRGPALELSGENGVVMPLGNFSRDEPFSVALWIQTPDHKERAVIVHRSRAWTDAGSRGYQLLIEDGRLSASLVHFWPGNAIGIRTREPIATGQWLHVAMVYEGSSRADGLSLWIDGRRAACEVVRDHLVRNIEGGGGDELTIGHRFRDRGFKGGLVDEVRVYKRAIKPPEVAMLAGIDDVDNHLAAGPEGGQRGEARTDWLACFRAHHDPVYRERLQQLHALRAQRSAITDTALEVMVMRETPEERPTYVLLRGAYDAPGELVTRATPASLPGLGTDEPRNRLGLAHWLTDRAHPLTARVAVNRLWQGVFGRGLVATPEDLGNQGLPPSHPELLDWLATDFVDRGWDVKRLVKMMVMSSTYRQDSHATAELLSRDPENVLLARGPRRRLSAEMIRDHALASSGLLVDRMGGPPVKPYEPEGLWEEKASGLKYVRDTLEGSRRRSVYTYLKRTSPPSALILLDASKRDVCVMRRQATNTPLQALLLLNDPQYVEAARALAERVIQEAGPELEAQVGMACRLLLGRPPSERERSILAGLYSRQVDAFAREGADPIAFLSIGDQPRDVSLEPIRLAAMTVVCQALFNHDESIRLW